MELGMSEEISVLLEGASVDEIDLARVRTQSEAKLMRHRLDDYLAIVLGVGSAIFLWLLQVLDWY
jgi:hypothetical protein